MTILKKMNYINLYDNINVFWRQLFRYNVTYDVKTLQLLACTISPSPAYSPVVSIELTMQPQDLPNR